MHDARRQPGLYLILFILVTAELTSAFEASMIYAALSKLHQLYGDPIHVGWLITAFLLVSAGAAAVCSRLGDIYGRRRMLLIMLGMAALGSLISIVAESLTWIIVGRAVQGASAAILPLCFGLAQERLPARTVPLAIGIIAGTAMLGAAMGLTIGGMVIDHLAWQTIFYISFAMALFAMLLVWRLLPERTQTTTRNSLDLLGGVLFVPALTGILFAITRAPSWGWFDLRTLALLGASLALLAFWARYELRHPHPLIDIRLFRHRPIWVANLCLGLVAFGAFQSMMILLPLMQQPAWTLVGLGVSATIAGAAQSVGGLFSTVGASTSGYLSGRFGGRRVVLWGSALLVLTWLILPFHHDTLWLVLSLNVVSSLGMVAVFAAVPNLIVEATPPERVSEATGINSVIRAIFGALGAQAIAAALASSTLSAPSQGPGSYPSQEAYLLAMGLVLIPSILCWLTAWLLPKRRPSATPRKGIIEPEQLQRQPA